VRVKGGAAVIEKVPKPKRDSYQSSIPILFLIPLGKNGVLLVRQYFCWFFVVCWHEL